MRHSCTNLTYSFPVLIWYSSPGTISHNANAFVQGLTKRTQCLFSEFILKKMFIPIVIFIQSKILTKISLSEKWPSRVRSNLFVIFALCRKEVFQNLEKVSWTKKIVFCAFLSFPKGTCQNKPNVILVCKVFFVVVLQKRTTVQVFRDPF